MSRLRISMKNFGDLPNSSGQLWSGLGQCLGNARESSLGRWRNSSGYYWKKLACRHADQW
jgi:hypothetical protein